MRDSLEALRVVVNWRRGANRAAGLATLALRKSRGTSFDAIAVVRGKMMGVGVRDRKGCHRRRQLRW